jgi:hypothetical protein
MIKYGNLVLLNVRYWCIFGEELECGIILVTIFTRLCTFYALMISINNGLNYNFYILRIQ